MAMRTPGGPMPQGPGGQVSGADVIIYQDASHSNAYAVANNPNFKSYGPNSTHATIINNVLTDINTNKGGWVHIKGYSDAINNQNPYNILTVLSIPANGNCKITGDGYGQTLLKVPVNNDNNLFGLSGSLSNNSFFNYFEGMHLYGNNGAGGSTNTGFQLDATTNGLADSIFERLFIERFKQDCIFMAAANGYNNQLNECIIEHAGRGGLYRATNTSETRVFNSKFIFMDGTPSYGIYSDGLSMEVVGCRFYKNNGHDLFLDSNSRTSSIIGNNFIDAGQGTTNTYDSVHVEQCSTHAIVGNNISCEGGLTNFPRSGYWQNGFATDIVFEGNYVGPSNWATAAYIMATANRTHKVRVKNNASINPVGQKTTAMFDTTGNIISIGEPNNAPTASTDFVVWFSDILLTSTGGTGVSITIKDNAGNTVQSPGATATAVYVPLGYKVNFGAFSVAPTVTVFFT